MQRSQWISVLTGVVAVILGVGYLILVQILDWRGGECCLHLLIYLLL